jgi:hypothetical protein
MKLNIEEVNMNKNTGFDLTSVSHVFISVVLFAVFQLLSETLPLCTLAQAKDETEGLLGAPAYTQVEFNSLVGEIFVNPRLTGKITTVRTFLKEGSPRDNPVVNVRETKEGWEKIVVSSSETDAVALIATGRKGSLKISLSKGEVLSGVEKIRSLNQIIIAFGQLESTLITPDNEILKTKGLEINIFDFKESRFIKGDIMAMKDNQIAVEFHDLPPTVVNKDGMIRVSLKTADGVFLGADLKAWGYNLYVADADVGKPAPIKADVFGLPEDAKLKFTFDSLSGQNITPDTKTITVKEINNGTPIAKIVTSIAGSQPLSVLVERVD